MNFSFLEDKASLSTFYSYCCAAENLALTNVDVSITAARMAMEYMVKLLYGAAVNSDIAGLTTFDMLSDYDFVRYIDDRALMDAFHFIRKKGNIAVHQGSLTDTVAIEVLEKLHFVAGETAIFLGIVDNYPPFNAALQEMQEQSATMPVLGEQEPQVDFAVIQQFSSRLRSVTSYSAHRFPRGKFVDSFVSGKKTAEMKKQDPSVKGTDLAANSRIAFHEIVDWFVEKAGAENVMLDNNQQTITLCLADRTINVAVKSGGCRLAIKTPQGEWAYMPGVDYVLYAPKVEADKPVLEQFRVFTAQELVKMWQDAGLIRVSVSSGLAKKLKQILGPDVKITIDEYGNEMNAQILRTAHQKKQKIVYDRLAEMPMLDHAGYSKIVPDGK